MAGPFKNTECLVGISHVRKENGELTTINIPVLEYQSVKGKEKLSKGNTLIRIINPSHLSLSKIEIGATGGPFAQLMRNLSH